ncbi:hypothetical protein Osc1_10450 [Hominimerdicola sp. 21CYCFAH17_S]
MSDDPQEAIETDKINAARPAAARFIFFIVKPPHFFITIDYGFICIAYIQYIKTYKYMQDILYLVVEIY